VEKGIFVMPFTSADTNFERIVLAVEQTTYVDGRTVSYATRLNDDLQLRRLDRIRLAMYLEEAFDVEIPDEAVERFDTVGDIANYVSRWSLGSTDVSPHTWQRV
jgi:acyl carrier protein